MHYWHCKLEIYTTPSLHRYGDGRKLLLHAICNKTEMRMAGRLREIKGIVPLVCDQVWSLILTSYRHSRLKILVEQNRPLVLIQKSSLSSCVKGRLPTSYC